MKVSKISKTFSKVFENIYVLYFVFFLALLNLFGFLITGNFNAIVFFILVGYLVYNFTKNMIIVLTVPLVLTSIFMVGKKIQESFQDSSDATSSASPSSTSPEKKKENNNVDIVGDESIDTDSTEVGTDSKEVGEVVNDNDQTDAMTTMYKKNNRIDYASTVEDAYEDLGKILGGDGINRLTQDTQKLMKQQLQLADAMKNMTPLLESAKGLLQGFDMKNLNSLSSLAKNFNIGNQVLENK
jgi:hypothetical protein